MRPEDIPASFLIARAMTTLGATNAPQLADKLGMTKRNQEKTVSRWIVGHSKPNYGHTLKLLAVVELFRDDAEEYLQAAQAEAEEGLGTARGLGGEGPPRAAQATG